MAYAQILLLLRGATEVPAEVLRASVEAAARREALSVGSWTYDVSPGTVVSDGTEERVTDGVWAGFSSAPTGALPAGSRRQVLTAFRQNVSGQIVDGADGGTLARVAALVRADLQARGVGALLRSGFRTLRNRLAWDRDIPHAIELGDGGLGAGSTIALGLLFFGLATMYGSGATKRRGGLKGWRGRRARR